MPEKVLSGAAWVAQFPDAGTLDALDASFRPGCEAFIGAMDDAEITVHISSTRRPAERAYLMHYSWRIAKRTLNPDKVPAKAGVDIEWVHRTPTGVMDLVASRRAASDMVAGYDIAFQPALHSLHVAGKAIDMSLSWEGDPDIQNQANETVKVKGAPRNGFNATLRKVGRSYGVIKHPSDPPHWSVTGK